MEKLVLIDGNSLLNRAYYAMSVFSTKDGLPTNGIFGFVKLIFKIMEEEHPEYFAVAFDVHAPTFRHKMYSAYKGTRKPMPEDLARQVPELKLLLQKMNICMVEKEGFEADDLIGTLSRKFDGVKTLIYTGDRDSYQLVDENVSVCFTKRGVSDIDLMTVGNFYEKEKLFPRQIVDLKALMGDSSDNIPGVRGIGPRSAIELLDRYGDLDGVYAHLDEIKATVSKKLADDRESAYLSRALATIDLAVDLDVTLEDCRIELPFSEEAREAFARLEFRSLTDSAFFPERKKIAVDTVLCRDLRQFSDAFGRAEEFFFCAHKDDYHVYCGDTEFIIRERADLCGDGIYRDEINELLKMLFTGEKRAVLADVKILYHELRAKGIAVNCPVEDVTLLRYLSDSNLRPVNGEALAKDYLLPENNCAYALKKAYEEAREKISGTEYETIYRTLELPLARVLFEMEETGVCVDESKFTEFSEKFNGELKELSEQLYALAGEPFNLNSPFKISEILFEKLGYSPKGVKKNIRGGYSTSAEVLEKLADESEFARLILRYREIQKLQSTYIDGIRPLVKEGIVHTTYNQTMTTTGRLSSANPNLQNIPVRKEYGRELRKLFVARKGNILIDADYSQIELRLLAHFSGCKPLLEAYRAGKDIHATTASQVFGVPLSEVTPDLRRKAKTFNFGILYGMSAFGLAKDLGCSSAEAQAFIDKYFATYSDVKEYMEANVARAKEDGYITTILGRRRYIPEIRSSNYNVRSFGERAAMNMPLQGSSADIIKIAMLRVADRLKAEKLKAKMVLQVHDELVLDAPEEEKERASSVLREEMENAVSLNVPLVAEVSTGVSWYDAK